MPYSLIGQVVAVLDEAMTKWAGLSPVMSPIPSPPRGSVGEVGAGSATGAGRRRRSNQAKVVDHFG
jgi:hypothetical protein